MEISLEVRRTSILSWRRPSFAVKNKNPASEEVEKKNPDLKTIYVVAAITDASQLPYSRLLNPRFPCLLRLDLAKAMAETLQGMKQPVTTG